VPLGSHKKVEGFTGYMGNELNNITFAGDREAAVDTLSNLGVILILTKEFASFSKVVNINRRSLYV
jgi:hypothetical protein